MIDSTGRARGPGRHRKVRPRIPLLFVLGVVAFALTLRPRITGLGAVLNEVTADLRLPGWQAGLVTTLPVLCFAVLGSLAPAAAEWFGAERLLAAVTAISAVGLAARAGAGSAVTLLAATAAAMTTRRSATCCCPRWSSGTTHSGSGRSPPCTPPCWPSG